MVQARRQAANACCTRSTTSRYLAVTPTEFQRSMQMAEERQREQTQQRRSGNKQTRKRA